MDSIRFAFSLYLLSICEFSPITTREIKGCDFLDTVNITGSRLFENGSYEYENLVIPPELTGTYNMDLVNGNERIRVGKHLRGCVCKIKSCIKFCCHPNEIKKENYGCVEQNEKEQSYSRSVEVTMNNGTQQIVNVLNEFFVQKGNYCPLMFRLHPQYNGTDDNWQLYENGTMLRIYDKKYLNKGEYCLTPVEYNDGYLLNPYNCALTKQDTVKIHLNRIGMLLSIPFLLLTVLVYLAIPEFRRKLHGKCLICYLLSLALGYSMFIVMSYEDTMGGYTTNGCAALGYIAYYSFMAAFIWLSVISFDLFNSFGESYGRVTCLTNRRFSLRSLFVWSLAAIFTILIYCAQSSELIAKNNRPGFGGEFCWFNTELWTPMIYFYGPNLVIMLFNLTMFILTAVQIYRVQKEMNTVMTQRGNARNFNSHKEIYGVFLRLFIVMGVPWLLESVSYMIGNNNAWSHIFRVVDICNASQGAIIFVLFVVKKKTIKLIKRIFNKNTDTNTSISGATKLSLKPIK